MGLNSDSFYLLVDAKRNGASFEKIICTGRPHLNVDSTTIRKTMTRAGLFNEALYNELVSGSDAPFADKVFTMLGARTLDIMDVSQYEGANVIHDLNEPIRAELKEQYDLLFDAGTLEHIFNCTTGLRCYMEMLKIGGSMIVCSPGNTWMGNGFYQLGPDFFYRSLCPENGFRVERMIITALGPFKRWYEVSDPKDIKERTTLTSFLRQQLILVHAVKTASVDPFHCWPQQQSYEDVDYTRMNKEAEEQKNRLPSNWLVSRLKALRTAWLFYSRDTVLNRKRFKPVPKFPSHPRLRSEENIEH